ncbi:MAG TPA: ABC transporter substrate-binding protein, partial [Defluviitoga tunisiensis]|nr:ABC transporter substrate-binding protein [Defluviitoga tunisiensis]
MKKNALLVLMSLLLVVSFFSQLANVPRNETLISEIAAGKVTTAYNFNTFVSTWRSPDRGIQQLMLEPLWMNDQALGE